VRQHHCFSHFLQFKINFFAFPLFNFRVLKNRIDKSLFPLSFCVCYLHTFSIIRTRMCVCIYICISIVMNAYSNDNESLIFNFLFYLSTHACLQMNIPKKIINRKLNYWLWQIMNYHAFKLNSINVIGKCLWRLINSIGSQTVWTIIIIRNDGLCKIYVISLFLLIFVFCFNFNQLELPLRYADQVIDLLH